MEVLGVKVEVFYIALRNCNKEDIIYAIDELEAGFTEDNDDVTKEIIQDCRKKAAQSLKSFIADDVRNLISSCRKKLNSKASSDVTEGSLIHNQKYLNTLVELLGNWSNLMTSLENLSFTLKNLIFQSLHSRIIEMAFDCFIQFKDDKNLSNWHHRVRDVSSDFSVISLDSMLSQMSAMRDIIAKYKQFYSNFSDIQIKLLEIDFQNWRELDAVYIDLESAYLSSVVSSALQDLVLLEIEAGVFVLQCVEDCFFLFQKVTERAVLTSIETNIMAVGNSIVEAVDPTQGSKIFAVLFSSYSYRNAATTSTSSSNNSYYPQKEAGCNVDDPGDSSYKSCSYSTPLKAASALASASGGNEHRLDALLTDNVVGNTSATNIGADLAISAVALAGAAGDFFSVFTSPQSGNGGGGGGGGMLGTPLSWLEGLALASGATGPVAVPVPSSSASSTPYHGSASTIGRDIPSLSQSSSGVLGNNAFLQPHHQPTSSSVFTLDLSHPSHHSLYNISIPECTYFLNSVAIAVHGLEALLDYLGDCPFADTPAVSIIIQEFTRCENRYKDNFQLAARALLDRLYSPPVNTELFSILACLSYDTVSSEDMELRSGSSTELTKYLTSILTCQGHQPSLQGSSGSNSSSNECDAKSHGSGSASLLGSIRSRLSMYSYHMLLLQLATGIADSLFEFILSASFSEWGAMLFHEEALVVVQIVQTAADCVEEGVRSAFSRLLWACKILTLDQPGDIVRYTIPEEILAADTVRLVLGRRNDFSPEAVAKVKLPRSRS